MQKGPENVRVEDIAEAAGVSPRTYNNYFSSREQAIVAAVTAEREAALGRAVIARSSEVSMSTAVIDAVVDQYTDPLEHNRDALLLITTHPSLQTAFLAHTDTLEQPLADAIAHRITYGGETSGGENTARVLAAAVGAAIRVALDTWLQPTTHAQASAGLVVPGGALSDILRATLAPLAPALDAA